MKKSDLYRMRAIRAREIMDGCPTCRNRKKGWTACKVCREQLAPILLGEDRRTAPPELKDRG